MTFAAGSRLGPYEILSPVGAGGIEEVYRAKDTLLEWTVAIKVLPCTGRFAGSFPVARMLYIIQHLRRR